MVIRGIDAGVLVDLAVNAPPDLPASATPAGPTLAPEELAGHKLLALFDRAAARDFADVYVLAHRFGMDVLLARATQIDDQILAHATTEGRALVTANIKDFIPLDTRYRAADQSHAGLILVSTKTFPQDRKSVV